MYNTREREGSVDNGSEGQRAAEEMEMEAARDYVCAPSDI